MSVVDTSPPVSEFSFSKIPPSAAEEAFDFHRSIAEGDAHIWPRTQAQIKTLADQGFLFGVRRLDKGELVGLCYVLLDEDSAAWEVGGLTVAEAFKRLGVGTFLVQLALAHTVAFESPFQNRQPIIAHVHEANPSPRNLLDRLGFEFTKRVQIPGATAPASMKRDEQGNVVGDEFALRQKALCDLADWLDGFTGTVPPSGAKAHIELGPFRLEDLRAALRSLAREFGDCEERRS